MAKLVFRDERLPARFWKRVIIARNDCWEWTGQKSITGYGKMYWQGSKKYVHRIVFLDGIPEGMVVDHICRNTSCCNPEHLEVVTPAENLARGIRPPRNTVRCLRGHSEEWSLSKEGHKICRACRRENQALYRSGKKVREDTNLCVKGHSDWMVTDNGRNPNSRRCRVCYRERLSRKYHEKKRSSGCSF